MDRYRWVSMMHGSIVLMLFAVCLSSCAAVETSPKGSDLMSRSESGKRAQVLLERDSGADWVGMGSAGISDLEMTILYDNRTFSPRTTADAGFAALIESNGRRLLFDTGRKGHVLLSNMQIWGVEPRSLGGVILSHEHGDHTGGMEALLDAGARPTFYVPSGFSTSFKERISRWTKIVEVTSPLQLFPGIHATGPVGKMGEQALAIMTQSGVVLITGCAHPGVMTMVKKAQQILPGAPFLLAGGFHLQEAARESVQTLVAGLKRSGVISVMPMHCTGDKTAEVFRSIFGEHCIEGGTGRKVIVK